MDLDFDRIMYDAENGDAFSMYKLARLYDIGAIEDASGSKYIYWFKKFWDATEVKAVQDDLIDKYEKNSYADSVIDTIVIQDSIKEANGYTEIMDKFVLRDYITEAGLALGMYYINSTDMDELKAASDYLYCAWIASGCNDIPLEELGEKTDIMKLMEKVSENLKELGWKPDED